MLRKLDRENVSKSDALASLREIIFAITGQAREIYRELAISDTRAHTILKSKSNPALGGEKLRSQESLQELASIELRKLSVLWGPAGRRARVTPWFA